MVPMENVQDNLQQLTVVLVFAFLMFSYFLGPTFQFPIVNM